mgnify:CR=1 FL=1
MTLTSTIRKIESELKSAEGLARKYDAQANVLKNQLASVARLIGKNVADFIAPPKKSPKRRGKISAAGLARIRAAQKKRWAKHHAKHGAKPANKISKGKRKMSAAQRAKISRGQKARWAERKKNG